MIGVARPIRRRGELMPSATPDVLLASSHQIAVEAVGYYNRLPVTQPLRMRRRRGDASTGTAAQRGRCTRSSWLEPLMIPTPTGGPLTPVRRRGSACVRPAWWHADGNDRVRAALGVFLDPPQRRSTA